MHIIDRYAYASRIRRVDPAQKAGLALLVIVLCLLLNRPAVGVMAVIWMWGLLVFWAGVPGRVFARVLFVEGLFLVLAVVGVALSFSLTPPSSSFQTIQVGPLWVGTTPASLSLAALLVSRALGCAAAMNFLALTTPLVDLVELLRRWRVPMLLIDLVSLIYRFIFVLLASMQRMQTAQQSRLGYSTFWNGMKSAGLLGSRLFVDAYQRSQRMQIALESRCYNGDLRVLPITYHHDRRVYWFGSAMSVSLVLLWGIA